MAPGEDRLACSEDADCEEEVVVVGATDDASGSVPCETAIRRGYVEVFAEDDPGEGSESDGTPEDDALDAGPMPASQKLVLALAIAIIFAAALYVLRYWRMLPF